ncbi:MAG: SpoIIE family protein phosphatase [Parasporobacterium sp.]|nr:SpoIIE family protein phosphatase [Parasporobacterium sp.]
MKEIKKNQQPGRISFWRSISFRIIIMVVILLLAATIVLVINNKRSVEENVDEYYSLSGKIVSEIAALVAEKYGNDYDAFVKSEVAEVLRRICREYEIRGVYIEIRLPDKNYSHDVLEITDTEIWNYGLTEGEDYPISEAEEKIFDGELESAIDKYTDNGKEYVSFMHGLYDNTGKCYAICGVDFLKSDVNEDIEEGSTRAIVFVVSIFAGLLLILIFILYNQIFSPVNKISRRMRGFVNGEEISEEKLEVRGSDEFAQMAKDFNTMNDEIHEYIRTMETVNAAANIQAGMIPEPEYETKDLKIDACMKPAKNVGGDFYDYIRMPEGRVCFVIADVSGKGISAALFMAQVITAIRYNTRQYDSPADLLKILNDDITLYNSAQMFVTVFIAVYDPAAGTLTCANAGHNPPYLIRDKLIPLDHEPDLLIGLFEAEEYHNVTVKVQPDDILFLYTDGVNEAVSKDGRFLGTAKMEEILLQAKEKFPETGEFTKTVLEEVEAFSEGAEQHDDITMMAVLLKKDEKSRSLVMEADLNAVRNVRDYILTNPLIPEKDRKKVYLAVEEVFVNVCKYAYNDRDQGMVRIDVSNDQNELEIRFTDSGIPYDPTADVQSVHEYDPDTMIGGLGKLLAFTIMDRTEYKYENEQNILILRKKLEKGENGNDN